MAQLLIRITSKPMRYERSVQPAKLQAAPYQPPQMNVSRSGGTLEMKQEQVKVQMDSVERRSSMGLKNPVDFAKEQGQKGVQMAMQATADYAEVGNQMMQAYKGVTVVDAALSKLAKYAQADVVLVPLSPINISWQPSSLDINYTPVNLSIDWNIARPQMEFVPSSVSMNITQYPSVQIEYLGGPVYAPPSADPNFKAQA
ncbi:MAG: DUF6470 family protein [Hydrogenoanaerobacterium sp.]